MCQKLRKERITKKEFYDRGGFANSALFRQQSRGGAWRYYVSLDYGTTQEVVVGQVLKKIMLEAPDFKYHPLHPERYRK